MTAIGAVRARMILDSRGHPTVEADVLLESGAQGRAAVPVGASTGRYEALELRDGGDSWRGRGVGDAIANIHEHIAPRIAGLEAGDQDAVDAALVDLDGTSSLVRLGANAILAVSLATAHAAAADAGEPLWQRLATAEPRLPIPMLNMLDGGLHADNRLLVQEFMLVPLGATSFAEALRMGADTYHQLGDLMLVRGLSRAVGDAGGYAAALTSTEAALELIVEAISASGYEPGVDIGIALDAAAGELATHGGYRVESRAQPLSTDALIEHWRTLCDRHPIVSLEDGLADEDWPGWRRLTESLGDRVQLVGDDLFATHPSLLQLAIDQKIANGAVIKPNQAGTLTRTLATIALAHDAGYAATMAHRAGDTEDTTIADLAVATCCRFIKAGAPARSERVGKYNRLLRIAEQLGPDAAYAGATGIQHDQGGPLDRLQRPVR